MGSPKKKRAASVQHVHRQQGMQIGADPARNVGGTDPLDQIADGGVIMLDNVTEADGGV